MTSPKAPAGERTTPGPPRRRPIALAFPGQPIDDGAWQVSDWAAGQSGILAWSPSHVVAVEGGGVDLVLGPAPGGASRPFLGGEVQFSDAAWTGAWRWTARVPRMVGGAVFGMFTFQADWERDPWLEFDIEFVGADTTRMRLNIHMETEEGRRVTLEEARRGPVLVELGFDAAEALHDYEIVVTAHEARFRVDGATVGWFGPEDMPEGTWRRGRMRAFANLWCADPALEAWAGRWTCPSEPLAAHLAALAHGPADEP